MVDPTNPANPAGAINEGDRENDNELRFWTSSNCRTGALDDGRTFNLDADGYITSLNTDQIGVVILFTGLPRDVALNGRRFVLRFDGDGDISYQAGASIISQASGRQVIQLDTDAASGEAIVVMKLTRANASNRVRNMRLTPEGGICRSNPLAAVASARMPWHTTSSTESSSRVTCSRHKVKPGITGWAQVNGWRGETDTIEKIQKRVDWDLYCIRNWCRPERTPPYRVVRAHFEIALRSQPRLQLRQACSTVEFAVD